jgi:hypothetical protein
MKNYCDEDGKCGAVGDYMRECEHFEPSKHGWLCTGRYLRKECTNPAAIAAANRESETKCQQ